MKRIEGCFIVKLGTDETIITKEAQLKLEDVIEHIYDEARRYLKAKFEHFIQGEPATIGFFRS